jgi:hypothetical protein
LKARESWEWDPRRESASPAILSAHQSLPKPQINVEAAGTW